MKGWFLGAYASYASLAEKSLDSDADYMRGLQDLPHLAGLELPFYSDLSETGSDKFLRTLPKHWEYIITMLPGTMNTLAQQAEYGLASSSSEGRKAAMSRMAIVHRRIHEINDRCGRQAVRAIEVHSAPRAPLADPQALYTSLEELGDWDWQGAKLLLEHCDAWRSDGESIKGFLRLRDELTVLKQVSVQLSLNWGRSVLEERSIDGAIAHLQEAQAHALLGAYFFSGTALGDPLYRSWTDSHVPLQLKSSAAWEPTQGLLTPTRVTEVCRLLADQAEILLGIKVQPAPSTLTLSERLDFLNQQIQAFEKARLSE